MAVPSDRRQAKRYYCKALLQMADSSEFKNIQLESINISSTGLFFCSNNMLEINKNIRLICSLPCWDNTVEATCKIVHNLETIPGKQYFIGVNFIQLDGITVKDLKRHLENQFN